MKPAIRTGLSLLPLALQLVAMASASAAISFFAPAAAAFLKTHEGKFAVPGPTRLLVEHTGAAKLVLRLPESGATLDLFKGQGGPRDD